MVSQEKDEEEMTRSLCRVPGSESTGFADDTRSGHQPAVRVLRSLKPAQLRFCYREHQERISRLERNRSNSSVESRSSQKEILNSGHL